MHRRAPSQTTSKPHMAQDRSATNKRVYTRTLQSDSVEAGVMRWRWLSIISSELMGFSQQSVHGWKRGWQRREPKNRRPDASCVCLWRQLLYLHNAHARALAWRSATALFRRGETGLYRHLASTPFGVFFLLKFPSSINIELKYVVNHKRI